MASEDYDLVGPIGAGFRAMKDASDATRVAAGIASTAFQAISVACTTAGVVNGLSTIIDLDSFGTWRKTDGTTATGDGTATLGAGDPTEVLTPPFTSALLLAVTNIAAGTGITGGTIYAEAAAPSGRANPPT